MTKSVFLKEITCTFENVGQTLLLGAPTESFVGLPKFSSSLICYYKYIKLLLFKIAINCWKIKWDIPHHFIEF